MVSSPRRGPDSRRHQRLVSRAARLRVEEEAGRRRMSRLASADPCLGQLPTLRAPAITTQSTRCGA